MSVEAIDRKGGRVWRVRWRDEQGNARSRVLGRKKDAELFDAEVKRRKRLGTLAELDRGSETLNEFVPVWWRRYAVPHLAQRTRFYYSREYDRHIEPRLGHLRLREITPDVIEEQLVSDMREAGVGDPSIWKALMQLSGIMQRATEWGRLSANPVRLVHKPSMERAHRVHPLSPQQVAALSAAMPHARDRAIVALMADAGLRPSELMALLWVDISDTAIMVDKAVDIDGGIKTTKTGKHRTVPLRPVARAAIKELGRGEGRVLRQRRTDEPFGPTNWTDWVQRPWAKARDTVGLKGVRPYDLRHTFISQLIHEGMSVVEVARQAGHSPTMTLRVYGHVFETSDQDAA